METKRHLPKFNSTHVLIFVMIIGVGLLLYPSVSDYWNSFHQSRAIEQYVTTVSNIDNSRFEQLWQEATSYNRTLYEKGNRYFLSEEETQEYNRLLNVNDTGIMSYIEIPSLRVSLPIYHGTSDVVLQVAIGHIAGSSLPVGGKTTHCVISGHRGLPSAKLFSNLDQLQKGDTFRLETLGETLTYEVDQIRIVLPDELEDIEIEEGMDLCTLVTCTPYGINSHRLLVRGHRIQNEKEHPHVVSEARQINRNHAALLYGIVIFAVIELLAIADAITGRIRNGRK